MWILKLRAFGEREEKKYINNSYFKREGKDKGCYFRDYYGKQALKWSIQVSEQGTDLTNKIKYYWGQPIPALNKLSLTSILCCHVPRLSVKTTCS